MITQADIIRTLVNRNCTDESVMSTALSPDCTPPKLLEKLTEAERFDLALDVSMKFGSDVMPLWRTWAMRCLKNRNFQGAREKFRHCFLRLRLPGNRALSTTTSPMQAKLLSDILGELVKLDETYLTLAEEVELIKQGRLNDHLAQEDAQVSNSVLFKPQIYEECKYYLKQYGSVEDHVRFYVRNCLWDKASEILLEKGNHNTLEKLLIAEVVQYLTSRGQFGDLISALLKLDQNIVQSARYFKSIYNFCLRHRRYHFLYYVQSSIGDYVAAANTQINFFFLRKPMQSYRELNHRLTNLKMARKNYLLYAEKIKVAVKLQASDNQQVASSKQQSAEGQHKVPANNFLTSMPLIEVERQLKLINQQIDITKNFAINEVSGCMSGFDLDAVNSVAEKKSKETPKLDDSPVTLFEQNEKRRTFLAALVLIYFDLSCCTYFSKNGLDLANQLIGDYGLNKLLIFKTAMRIIIDDESCDIVEAASKLLERIKENHLATIAAAASADSMAANQRSHSSKGVSSSASKKVAGKRQPQQPLGRAISQNGPVRTIGESKEVLKSSIESTSQVTGVISSSAARAKILDDARAICDEVIRDSIERCREPDYKMELAKLLSDEAKIELYIELGKLSNAQRLACSMNRPDYVLSIIEAATRLNQNHVKTVCQLWLAKHETKSPAR